MKIKLVGFILLLGFARPHAHTQDTFFQEGGYKAEEHAQTLTENYQPELVMTGDQTLLFRKKLEEFLIRENRIKNADLPTKDKLHMLGRLSQQQDVEMGTILTRPQLRRYNKIRHKIQPVSVIIDTLKN